MTWHGTLPRKAAPLPAELKIVRQDAGVDWLTWIEPSSGDRASAGILGDRLIEEERQRGERIRSSGFQGYSGWSTTHVFCGDRTDSTCLRLSGEVAACQWNRLAGLCGKPTRLDTQTSVLLSCAATSLGWHCVQPEASAPARRGRPTRREVTLSTLGAWIGRLGSRSSRLHVRVYDKGVESRSHQPGAYWRVEAEWKKEFAVQAWRRLIESKESSSLCKQLSLSALRRGGGGWPFATQCGDPVDLPRLKPRGPDEARALEWVRQQWAPTVRRFAEAGQLEQLLEAAGLDGYVKLLAADPRRARRRA